MEFLILIYSVRQMNPSKYHFYFQVQSAVILTKLLKSSLVYSWLCSPDLTKIINHDIVNHGLALDYCDS